jgi:hypothetical protein
MIKEEIKEHVSEKMGKLTLVKTSLILSSSQF